MGLVGAATGQARGDWSCKSRRRGFSGRVRRVWLIRAMGGLFIAGRVQERGLIRALACRCSPALVRVSQALIRASRGSLGELGAAVSVCRSVGEHKRRRRGAEGQVVVAGAFGAR